MQPFRCAAAEPTILADAKLAPGASGPEVALLGKRLVISADLAPELEAGESYDAALVDAVKHFRLRHGLEANGSVGPQTLRALNVPVAARIKQLEASLERLLGMDFVFAERYVVVNIPAAFVEAVAHDKVERISRHRRQDRQAVADTHRLHHRGESQSDLDRAVVDHQE